jgi:hypothetical protein
MYHLDLCNRAFPLAILASLIISACGTTPAQAPSLGGNSDTASPVDASSDTAADVVGTSPCTSSAECTDPNKVCDPLAKTCVACLYDTDCGAGSHCQAKACVPFKTCGNSLDCAGVNASTGQSLAICEPKLGECVECALASDCPPDHDCQINRCVGYQTCVNSLDCTGGKVCDPATSRCVACLGDGYCQSNQVCEQQTCREFVSCSSDKQCTQLGLLCDLAKGKCARCLKDADCPAIYHCSASGVAGTGECKLDVCKADQGQCDGNTAMACLASGSGFGAPQVCPAQTTCAVEGGVPACKPWLCQAGFSCVGDKAVQCRADGLEVLAETDCAANGQNCLAGECKALLCQPKQAYCDGNTAKLCDETGMASAVQKICTSKEYCNAGACKTGVCPPDQPVCDGNVAKVCNAQGSAFQGPGKNCGGGAVCVAGECLPKVCPAGGSFCEGNVVKVCDALGLSASAQKTCGSNEFCNDGACKAQVCAPSQPACDGNVAKVCNAQGSGYSGASTDCASKKCMAGVCSALVCQPATMFCESGKLKTCSPDGLSVVADQACATGTYCGLNKSGDAACLAWVCEPGKATCNGTVATTCKADGSGYQDAGTECKVQGKVCSAGVCKALLCDPQTPSYCDQNTAMKCDAAGLNPSTVQVCGSGQYCDKGACQAQVCSPGKPGCFGELASTCNANGSGYLAGGTDCKAAGQTCGAGVCINSYASCKAALTANPGAPDGIYPIDPDGAGPIAAANLFCDMKNGGLTLVANIYDSAGDDAPNSTDYVVSGWQQTGSGKWNNAVAKVDRDGSGLGSAAVSLEFIKALGASAGQKHLKMCFVHKDGYDTTCRDSADGSLTLVSHSTGNPKLTVYAADKLTYTFGRLAGLAGTADGYNAAAYQSAGSCVPRIPGEVSEFGNLAKGMCEDITSSYFADGVWAAWGWGISFAPYKAGGLELSGPLAANGNNIADPNAGTFGFRLYVGPAASTFSSCKAALAANPAAQDGVYPIDPDGAGPIAAANLFCDMKNGGLTLVANIYDSTGDDAPNSTDYVVSGWQQTGNGTWAKAATKVDRDVTGSGSAAVSLAFVAALKASAGQQNLKMCFVQQNGTESACRTSADNSLTLASYATGNPKLTVYGGDKLTYTFGRLAGLPGPMDCYNTNACFGSGYCIAVLAGGYFGNGCSTQLGICGFGGVGQAIEQPGFVWHGFCGGEAYAPYRTGAAGYLELANPEPSGFRLYVGL